MKSGVDAKFKRICPFDPRSAKKNEPQLHSPLSTLHSEIILSVYSKNRSKMFITLFILFKTRIKPTFLNISDPIFECSKLFVQLFIYIQIVL